MGQAECKIFPEFIPNDWRRDAKRRAELVLYDRLRDGLPAGWTVFYDVAWLARVRDQRPEDGQTDFIIIHPTFGVLLVELKGGQISYNSGTGQWTSTDLNGQTHEIKDPLAQVQRSKYALRNKLASVPGIARSAVPVFDAIAFPDVRVDAQHIRLDAPNEIVIDCDDLSKIHEKLLSIFSYWNAGQKHRIEPSVIDALIRLLAPSIDLVNPLSAQFDQENEDILRLTANQFKAMDGLRRVPRLAVSGCAGSGKTVLAIEKAKRLSEEGFRTLILSYNRHLADFFTTLLTDQPLVDVKTFHSLCSDAAKAAGLQLPKIGVAQQSQIDDHYPVLLCEAMEMRPELRYDAVIVDEAQDLHSDWWDALEYCLASGKQGIFYAFFDDNQKIYRRQSEIPKSFVSYELYDNIRNAQPIFKCAEYYYLSTPGRRIEPRGPAGRPVEWVRYRGKSDMQAHIARVVKRLVNVEQIRTSDIVILTPHSLEDKSALLELSIDGNLQLVKFPEVARKNQIGCSTIKKFKGLESDVVIVAELDEDLASRTELELVNELYVALSRARNHLVVLRSNKFDDSLLPI